MSATTLDLGDIKLGLGSDRQLRESLQPIDAGELRRTVNGTLTNLSDPAFRKYSISVSCDDLFPPTLSRIWRGAQVTVKPISELVDVIAVAGTSRTLERTPVAGSVRCVDVDGSPVACTVAGAVVTLGAAATKTVRVFFRPQLTMLVSSWSQNEDEAGAATSWSIDLEEV